MTSFHCKPDEYLPALPVAQVLEVFALKWQVIAKPFPEGARRLT